MGTNQITYGLDPDVSVLLTKKADFLTYSPHKLSSATNEKVLWGPSEIKYGRLCRYSHPIFKGS